MKKAFAAGFRLAVMWTGALLILAGAASAAGPLAKQSPAATDAQPSPSATGSPRPASPGDATAAPAPSPSAAPVAPAPAESPAASPTPAAPPSEAPALPALPGTAPEAPAQQPIIKAIEVEGNHEVPASDILQVVTSRIGDSADKDRIQRDLQNIYEMGFFTDVKVRTESFLNGVKVVYRVLENPKVRTIQITGNAIVPTEKIRSLMETKEGKILNTKTLFADITVINRYYDNELGYLLEPTHVTHLKFTPEGDLKMGVTEGVAVKDIKIVGNTAIKTDQLRPLVKMKVGQLFNQFTMKEDADRLSKFYEKKDYILDNIHPSIDKTTGVVTYQIIEAVVEDIRIEGNTRTRGYVIKRLMFTKVGKVLKRHRLKRDLERLNSSGFFESVNIEPEPGSEAGKVVLVLKVKEQKTGLATLGLGYTGGGTGAIQSGITGAISFSERNLNGRGQSASVSWQRGVGINSYGASYFDPAFNAEQDSFGFSFFSSNFQQLRQPVLTNGSIVSFALYDDKRTGYSLTYGKYLSEDIRGFLTFQRQHIALTQDAASQFVPFGLGSGDINSLTYSTLYDTRDDLFNPHTGAYANAAVTAAGAFLGGNFSYSKLQVEARQYWPVFHTHTVALRFWGGVGNGNLPLTEVFYIGGPDTIRAYEQNSFVGNHFVVFNAEYRFPIAKLKLLNGAVFTDAGDAWFTGQPIRIFKDVGVGLRIVFPSLGLGVIRVDYAFGERGSRSTIGLGQTF